MTAEIPAPEIERMKRLLREASPAPWEASALGIHGRQPAHWEIVEYLRKSVAVGDGDFHFVGVMKPDGPADVCHTGNGPTSQANAELIVLLRNNASGLLAALRAAQAEAGRMREAIHEWREADVAIDVVALRNAGQYPGGPVSDEEDRATDERWNRAQNALREIADKALGAPQGAEGEKTP